jgi:serine/threonine protein kinase
MIGEREAMLDPGNILQDRYEITRKIGEGGMGAVYLAKDRRLESAVALKETLFKDENLLRAFEREARLLAGLRHPALTKVSDHFTEGGSQYLVMDFISGDDLYTVLEKRRERIPPQGEPKPFTQDEVLNWADQLLDALDYLHSHEPPIIHRDIKPQNLKITERDHVILLDFGLAKGAASQTAQMTANKSIFGYTPIYAPIEQMQASGTDPRTDLYSLGATLYHLITGRTPPDALKRFAAVANGQPDPLAAANALNPQVSPAVAQVLSWAMARNRNERPENASAMRRALRDARRGQTASGAQKTVAPPRVSNYPATQASHSQPPNPNPSNPNPSNPYPSNPNPSNPNPSNPQQSYPQPSHSQPSYPPSNPNPSNPQPPALSSWPPSSAQSSSAQSSWPQTPVSSATNPQSGPPSWPPAAQSSWPQQQMPAAQSHYPHLQPQPAQKSNKALWIVISALAIGVVAIAIAVFVNLNKNDRSADLNASNSVSKSPDSGYGSSVPAANANSSSSSPAAKTDGSLASSASSAEGRIDETLNHYVEALGGRDAIQSVTSRVTKGALEMPELGVAGTVEIYSKAPNKYVFVMNVPNVGTIRSGYNGSMGWAQEPDRGLRRLEGAELAGMKRDAEFYKEIKLKELFSGLSFDGKESIEGRDAYVITAIAQEGGSQKWYFDAETGLMLRSDEERQTAQGMNTTESYIDQYKKVDGINLPFKVRLESGLVKFVIKMKEISQNVAINDSIFNMPSN